MDDTKMELVTTREYPLDVTGVLQLNEVLYNPFSSSSFLNVLEIMRNLSFLNIIWNLIFIKQNSRNLMSLSHINHLLI